MTMTLSVTMLTNLNKSLNTLLPDNDILDELLRDKRSPQTRRAYSKDLKDFFAFLELDPSPENVGKFLSLTQAEAVRLVLRYKASLRDRGLAPATINRRLAAIKSLAAYAEKTGRCGFLLSRIEGEKTRAYRDTSGVSQAAINKMLRVPNRQTVGGKRDYAILRLLWSLALRRSEVVSLSVADIDLDHSCVWVRGKGRADRERMTLTKPTREAIADWLGVYKPTDANQPLFISLAPNYYGERLSDQSVYILVRDTAKAAGIEKDFSPHKIRHSAITAALDNGADVRAVKRLSRHANLNTLIIYDDNRSDLKGEISRMLDRDI